MMDRRGWVAGDRQTGKVTTYTSKTIIIMETTRKFKTTIQCGGCLAAVTPSLNQAVGEGKWQVDINHPDKILTVQAGTPDEDTVIAAVNKAGFKAEPVQS
jgi:Copper chaperone